MKIEELKVGTVVRVKQLQERHAQVSRSRQKAVVVAVDVSASAVCIDNAELGGDAEPFRAWFQAAELDPAGERA